MSVGFRSKSLKKKCNLQGICVKCWEFSFGVGLRLGDDGWWTVRRPYFPAGETVIPSGGQFCSGAVYDGRSGDRHSQYGRPSFPVRTVLGLMDDGRSGDRHSQRGRQSFPAAVSSVLRLMDGGRSGDRHSHRRAALGLMDDGRARGRGSLWRGSAGGDFHRGGGIKK